MSKLAFIDTETTGLDPDRHEIWEVALIVREVGLPGDVKTATGPDGEQYSDTEYVWQLPVHLATADLIALNIGRYHERRWPLRDLGSDGSKALAIRGDDPDSQRRLATEGDMVAWAERFVALTWGATILGMVPSFDEERLRRLLVRLGQCPGWHYRPVDVETLAVGYRAGRAEQTIRQGGAGGSEFVPAIPWKSDDLSRAIGIDPDQFERHSALGDARWTLAIYDRIVWPAV